MPHLSDEEKIIICCNQLGGTLRAIEERARLAKCCDGEPMDPDAAQAMIQTAERCNARLLELLADEIDDD